MLSAYLLTPSSYLTMLRDHPTTTPGMQQDVFLFEKH